MSNSVPSLGFSWWRPGPRATAGLMQLLLWVLLCGFYFAWNNRFNFHFKSPVWPLVLLEMGFAIGLFNCLVYLIIPRWLLRGRHGLALAGAVVLVEAYRLWNYAGARLADAYLPAGSDLRYHLYQSYGLGLGPSLVSVSGFLNSLLTLLATMLFPIVVSFLAYALVVDRRRLALERDNFRLELGYLKAQINPQFLFDTLGSLHRLTRTRDARAGDVVLHLADLMRYTLYETDAERVPLRRELEFLEDYLALERLRNPAVHVTHLVTGAATTQQIAPLLLHSFLERLFAGLDAATGPVAVTIVVKLAPAVLNLTLIRRAAPVLPAYRTDAAVVAAQRRLVLQYPARHEVRMREENEDLYVDLSINL